MRRLIIFFIFILFQLNSLAQDQIYLTKQGKFLPVVCREIKILSYEYTTDKNSIPIERYMWNTELIIFSIDSTQANYFKTLISNNEKILIKISMFGDKYDEFTINSDEIKQSNTDLHINVSGYNLNKNGSIWKEKEKEKKNEDNKYGFYNGSYLAEKL